MAHVFGRREFLRRSALAAGALPGAAGLLAACTSSGDGTRPSVPIPPARPDEPVTLPLFDDNPAIASGLPQETGGVFRIFNWGLYLSPDVIGRFEQEHGITVVYDRFESMAEAVATLRESVIGGNQALPVPAYDLFFPTIEVIGTLVAEKLIQPINHDYLSNLQTAVWERLRSPFYDVGSRYTVPYTMWTDGIAWRNDLVKQDVSTLENPYDALWTAGYRNREAVLSEPRDALALAMMRRGVRDVNTEDPAVINRAGDDLQMLVDRIDLKFNHLEYDGLPEGRFWLRQSWSGTVVFSPKGLPRGSARGVISLCGHRSQAPASPASSTTTRWPSPGTPRTRSWPTRSWTSCSARRARGTTSDSRATSPRTSALTLGRW
jgi:spermidine/putrescine transport system substrate-binding protein